MRADPPPIQGGVDLLADEKATTSNSRKRPVSFAPAGGECAKVYEPQAPSPHAFLSKQVSQLHLSIRLFNLPFPKCLELLALELLLLDFAIQTPTLAYPASYKPGYGQRRCRHSWPAPRMLLPTPRLWAPNPGFHPCAPSIPPHHIGTKRGHNTVRLLSSSPTSAACLLKPRPLSISPQRNMPRCSSSSPSVRSKGM